MATAIEVITKALVKIGVYAPGEAIPAEDAALCLGEMNDMLHGLRRRGVNYAHVTIPATSSVVPIPDQEIFDVVILLAAVVAPSFSRPPPDPTSSLQAMQAAYFSVQPARVDGPLDRMPSQGSVPFGSSYTG